VKSCRAILWDVYGTLIAAECGDLDSLVRREVELRVAFERTVHNFSLNISPAHLHREFLRLIAEMRTDKQAAGVVYPEVRIEEIWLSLLDEARLSLPLTTSFAQEVALYFERHANPKQLMPDALPTLLALQQRGLRQGIVSNAQFYTAIELNELLAGRYPALFDPQLVFFSCDLGIAKPDLTGFRRAAAVLLSDGITPAECVVVGDSATHDITPARQVGFEAVQFSPTGDIQRLPQLLERV
jgi:putative hydrolase of the HAD superfamily